jgi:hypothetical protein
VSIFNIDQMPEVFLSTDKISYAVSRAAKAGKIRKIGPKLYTANLMDSPEQVIRRNFWHIAGMIFPGAVVVDRTAIENIPASDGSVFLSSASTREVELPGITLRSRKGQGPLKEDRPFIGGLFISSPARAYLENMAPSRARKGVARRLSREEVEQRLDADIRIKGEDYIKALRDEVRRIAPKLRLEKAQAELDKIIGTLLGTRDAKIKSDIASARAAGQPFDPHRLDLFTALHEELMRTDAPIRRDPNIAGMSINLPFFEAYFSNFIEGTEFEVSEAAEIVFEGRIPEQRPADAHDILGTYRVVSSKNEMSKLPETPEEFVSLMRARHVQVMEGRPDKAPGQFKTRANQAGATLFVEPSLVEGTLKRGFEIYQVINEPFNRAAFMMFLVAEVHPFADGNGRLARIMMNAELVAADECRIIIPTIYRNNYLAALRALSQNQAAEPMIRMLNFAQKYTMSIDFSTYETAKLELRQTNAFMDPGIADEEGFQLKLP